MHPVCFFPPLFFRIDTGSHYFSQGCAFMLSLLWSKVEVPCSGVQTLELNLHAVDSVASFFVALANLSGQTVLLRSHLQGD